MAIYILGIMFYKFGLELVSAPTRIPHSLLTRMLFKVYRLYRNPRHRPIHGGRPGHGVYQGGHPPGL